ncbi:sulfotransferase 1C2-like [Glandiceps talaboti]
MAGCTNGSADRQVQAKDSDLHYFEGVPFLSCLFPADNLLAIKTFEVREDDIFIITYPKSGTTWMQQILYLILNSESMDKAQNLPMTKRVPFLEITRDGVPQHEYISSMTSPRAINTHLPDHLLPSQIWVKKPKIIYVARNPKDVMVSYFEFKLEPMSWNEWFGNFLEGKVNHGSWFDHVPKWWSRRNDNNVLFILYEDMIKNHRKQVQNVANFLGKALSEDVIDEITKRSSFMYMKNQNVSTDTLVFERQNSMLRKGIVGDWKNYFTVEQNERFDNEYKRLKQFDLKFCYNTEEN